MLFGSIEQTQLILFKRAEDYQLALRAPNQLKNLFLLVKHIYSYPAELKKLFFIRTLSFKNKVYQPITPLLAHPVLTSVLYISHTFRQIYITYSEHNRSIGFFSFLDDIHRLEHMVPYYHYFQEGHVEAKNILLKQALSIFLEIPILVKCIPKSVSLEGKQMPYSNMGIIIHLKKYSPF